MKKIAQHCMIHPLVGSAILTILALVIIPGTALAMEPYGGKSNYMSFALGGYAPAGDFNDEGYKSGSDFCFNYMHV